MIERGYKGKIYFNHGVANNDFLRVGGKDVDGAFVPASPVIVASQLPDAHPAKKRAEEYTKLYEATYGPGSVSAFGSYTWDACLELANAIPQALKVAQPGTKEFRRALRDALEATKELPVTNGVVNMSKTDHLGLDSRARVMVQIKDGKFVLQVGRAGDERFGAAGEDRGRHHRAVPAGWGVGDGEVVGTAHTNDVSASRPNSGQAPATVAARFKRSATATPIASRVCSP